MSIKCEVLETWIPLIIYSLAIIADNEVLPYLESVHPVSWHENEQNVMQFADEILGLDAVDMEKFVESGQK